MERKKINEWFLFLSLPLNCTMNHSRISSKCSEDVPVFERGRRATFRNFFLLFFLFLFFFFCSYILKPKKIRFLWKLPRGNKHTVHLFLSRHLYNHTHTNTQIRMESTTACNVFYTTTHKSFVTSSNVFYFVHISENVSFEKSRGSKSKKHGD